MTSVTTSSNNKWKQTKECPLLYNNDASIHTGSQTASRKNKVLAAPQPIAYDLLP